MKTEKKAYHIVASELREQILSGELRPQQQLPTEQAMGEKFGVSRITVRHALEILEEEHLIHKRQGKGSFVSPHPALRIPLLIDYARSVRTHAPRLRRELRIWKWVTPPPEETESLKLPAGDRVLYCQRVDILDTKPVAFDRAYIPRSFAEGLSEENMSSIEFNDLWPVKSRFEIVSCRQIVEAVASDDQSSGILHIDPGSPLLKGTEIYFTHNKRPTGIFINYYHPEHISLVSNFSWSSPARHDGV